MFQIIEVSPLYCAITDGIIGERRRVVETGILTEGWAHKRAGILHRRDYDGCGDNAYYPARAGEMIRTPWRARLAADAFDDMPF